MLATLKRLRWLEWTTTLWWLLLGGGVSFYVPRLESVFASFGAELPAVTRLWLRSRFFFALALATALVAAVLLVARPPEPSPSRRWRLLLWGLLAGAALTTYWSVSALFSPMMMGSLTTMP